MELRVLGYTGQQRGPDHRRGVSAAVGGIGIQGRGPVQRPSLGDRGQRTGGSFETVDRLEVVEDWGLYSADISSCGPDATDLGLQNVLADAGPLQLRSVEVCSSTECEQLLDTQLNRLEATFEEVAGWARANNRPIFVGEFGTYFEADMASRARWTAQVQKAALAAGMSTSYWEFIADFGAYNGEANEWRRPLLDALIG